MSRVVILTVISFLSLTLYSQYTYTTKNKKSIKYFELAVGYYENSDYLNAKASLKSAIKIDSNFVEAYNLFAQIYEDNREIESAIICYKKAIQIAPDFSYKTYYFLAEWQLKLGQYVDAKENFQNCASFKGVTARYEALSNALIERADFGINAIANPVDFNPINLGEKINTEFNDYSPTLTADGQQLMYVVHLPDDMRFPVSQMNSNEDFYHALLKDNEWQQANNIGLPINTNDNEGAQTLSVDGNIMFFTRCIENKHCNIYYSKKNGDNWSEPVELDAPINTHHWDTQPCFSSDGKTLFFVSTRSGGYGNADIWMAQIDNNGIWSEPKNLGKKVNTNMNELTPFIHPDGKTLYFASQGHLGMGGLDLFFSRKDSSGEWQEPVNLGYPINTYMDDRDLFIDARGDYAYYSSEREGSRKQDLYKFELPDSIKPTPVTYVKGKVYDSKTKLPLEAAFELINLESGEVVVQAKSNRGNGEYLICLPIDENYAFNASRSGYVFYSENFSLKEIEDPTKPYIMDIPLDPIMQGSVVELKNIFYETDKYLLKPESKIELMKLVNFLNDNSNLEVEIGGHTDNIGSLEHNQTLSENRAKSVYLYLVDHGIEKQRLSYKGYNFSQSKYPNDTPENRSKNRRTEFKIIKVN